MFNLERCKKCANNVYLQKCGTIETILKKFGFDIPEKRPRQICSMIRAREPCVGLVLSLDPNLRAPPLRTKAKMSDGSEPKIKPENVPS